MIKKLIFFIFLIGLSLSKLLASECNLVYVHLGDELPSYLYTSVKQSRKFNPEMDIFLIGNQKALKKHRKQYEKLKVELVACEKLVKSKDHRVFLKKSRIDSSFRKGFWKYAIERFFYLDAFIQSAKLSHVFHLESDNMLYIDLKDLLPTLKQHYPGIAATFDNDNRCIAGIIYFAGPHASKSLCHFMAKTASKNYNDMDALSHFKNQNDASVIDHLPIVFEQYKEPLVSPAGHKVKQKGKYMNHCAEFRSIFDAAAIGQYLGGIDPRNGEKGPGFINESCVFNPSKMQFIWKMDEKGRRIPFAKYGEVEYRVNNLHIHSKQLDKFQSCQ